MCISTVMPIFGKMTQHSADINGNPSNTAMHLMAMTAAQLAPLQHALQCYGLQWKPISVKNAWNVVLHWFCCFLAFVPSNKCPSTSSLTWWLRGRPTMTQTTPPTWMASPPSRDLMVHPPSLTFPLVSLLPPFSFPFLSFVPLCPPPLPFSTHRSFSYPLCRVLLLSSFFPTLPRSYTQHNSDNNAHSKFMSNIKYSLPLIHSPLPPLLFSFWPYMVKIQL